MPDLIDMVYVGEGVSLILVTFDLYYTPPTLTSTNQIAITIGNALSGWRRACVHVKGCLLCAGCVAPPTQEVGCVIVLGVCTDIIVCILMLSWLCCASGNVGGELPVSFH